MNRATYSFSLIIIVLSLLLSGCGTMDMRKIIVNPHIPEIQLKQSSRNVGLILDEALTNYRYTFETGMQLFLLSRVAGSIDVGKPLSQAIYAVFSNKFGNVALAKHASQFQDVEIYFVPQIVFFEYSPPFTGYSSHQVHITLVINSYKSDGTHLSTVTIKQSGSRSNMAQFAMESNYEMAEKAVNEGINNVLSDIALKLNEQF